MLENLNGKVALVTGGATGIGRGIANRLAARGCHVVIVGRRMAPLREAADMIGGTAIEADVTDIEALRNVASNIWQKFGRLDILVNNAGVGPVGRLDEMTQGDWSWLLGANLWGVINGLEAFLPHLKTNAERTYILNTSSISGMFTAPTIGGYAATKYAVVALSETLAMEMAAASHDIGVSVFLPGPIRSEIHAGSDGRPNDLANGTLKTVRLEDAEGFEGVTIPWMEADEAGEIAVRAMLAGELYIWTHPEGAEPILERFRSIEHSIAMSRMAKD